MINMTFTHQSIILQAETWKWKPDSVNMHDRKRENLEISCSMQDKKSYMCNVGWSAKSR